MTDPKTLNNGGAYEFRQTLLEMRVGPGGEIEWVPQPPNRERSGDLR